MNAFLTPDDDWVIVKISYEVTVDKEVWKRAKAIAEKEGIGEGASPEEFEWMNELAEHVDEEIYKQQTPAFDLGSGEVVRVEASPH